MDVSHQDGCDGKRRRSQICSPVQYLTCEGKTSQVLSMWPQHGPMRRLRASVLLAATRSSSSRVDAHCELNGVSGAASAFHAQSEKRDFIYPDTVAPRRSTRTAGENVHCCRDSPSLGAAALTWRVGWKRFLKYFGFIVQRLEREPREPSVPLAGSVLRAT